MGKKRTCDDCLWNKECEHSGEICKKHMTIFERRDKLDFTLEEWENFTREWDETRNLLRKYKQV